MGSTISAATDPSYRRVPLARGTDGDPFTVPGDAYAWRVRRFRNPGRPGACELVYGDDAAPLEIAIDTPIAEFRELVANRAGRYRLDAVDGDGVAVPKMPPAYLQIDATDARAPTTIAPAVPSDPTLEALREVLKVNAELARTNAELARSVIERFPAMMDSAAGLIRAADGAGLPQRTPNDPRNASAVTIANDNQGDDDDDEIAVAGWPSTVKSVVDQLVPMVQMVIAHRMGNAAPRNANAETTSPASSAPVSAAPTSTPAATTATAPRPSDAPAPTPRSIAPTADQLAHFAAIQVALTPREGQIARALVAELRPDEVAAWLRELCALAVPDAVALIRRHLAQTAPPAPVAIPEIERPTTGH